MQYNIKIGIYEMPVVEINDSIYYPLSTINKIIYLRDGLSLAQRKPYEEYCKFENVKYETATNKTNVISHEGLIEFVKTRRIGTFNLEQKKNHNMLCEYLGLEKINELETVIDELPFDISEYYDEYELILLNNVQQNIKYAYCKSCGKYYPIHENFYNKDTRAKLGYSISNCRKCITGNFSNENRYYHTVEVNSIDSSVEQVNKMILDKGCIMTEWKTDENINSYFTEVMNKGEFDCDSFTYELFKDVSDKLNISSSNKLYSDIGYLLFGKQFFAKPYKNKDRKIIGDLKNIIDFEFQKMIFDNYLIDNNIVIDDAENFKYGDVIDVCGLKYILSKNNSNYLEFVEAYNDYEIPAYKFKTTSNNYWNDKNNRIKNLKQFIESEIDIDMIEKLPIYLTKMFIKNKSNTLYNVMMKYYKLNLFDFVNEVYPSQFKPEEFDIHYNKMEFDSIDEMNTHNILKEKFDKHLIYNYGEGSTRLFFIGNYAPDWLVTLDKPIIVEYFGMYSKNIYNKRVSDYISKHDKKVKFYNSIENYDKLYIYPSDLTNDFYGLKIKLEQFNI